MVSLLYMSIIKFPSTRNYWSSSIAVPQIANVMPVKRFEELKKLLHFSDNTHANMNNKITKIGPLVETLNERLQCI